MSRKLKLSCILILLMWTTNVFATDDFPGTALDFDGIDDFVLIFHSNSLDITNTITIEAWVYFNSFENYAGIFCKGTGNGGEAYCMDIQNSAIRFFIRSGGTAHSCDGSPLTLNEWHHVVGQYDGENIITYVDGIKTIGHAFSGSIDVNGHGVSIGSRQSGSEDYDLNVDGKIEEVRIWNNARSKTEIRENMHLPLSGAENGLVGYWQCNDGWGNVLSDATGIHYGVLHNMDDSDWIDSTIPFGGGFANTQIISTTGIVDFTNTDLSIDFTAKTGTDTIVVNKLNLAPNINPTPSGQVTIFDSQYWVVNRFGTGSFNMDITFTVNEDLTANDESSPSDIKLFTRSSIDDTDWLLLREANSVNAATNEVTFCGISDLSQFIIGRVFEPAVVLLEYPLQFSLITEEFNSIHHGYFAISSPTFTDLDGNNLLDLIIGEEEGTLSHWEQNSIYSSSFSLVTNHFNSIDVGDYSIPTFTDIDGDGMLDLIIGEEDGHLHHYEQNSINSTSFSLVTTTFNSIDVGTYSAPVFTDLDSNGLLDLIIGKSTGKMYHYEQDAINSASFSLVTSIFNSIDVGSHSYPTFTDLDGDGLLDLIIGENSGNLNHFQQYSMNSTYFSIVTSNFNSINMESGLSAPTFTDIDGDYSLDLIIGELDAYLSQYEQKSESSLDFGNVFAGNGSASQKNYYVKANNLVSDLQIECPECFTTSLSESTGFGQTLSIIPENGKISDLLYIRFEPDSAKIYSGNIIHTSTAVDTKYVSVNGIGAAGLDNYSGTALDFDGSNDYVEIQDDNSLDLTTNYTIEAWIKPGSFIRYGGIVSKYHTDGSYGYNLRLSGASPHTGLSIDGMETDNGIMAAGQWYHIAAVNENGARRLYLNGNEQALTGTPITVHTNSNPLRIGVDYFHDGRYFNGKIDEVRFWNVSRSQTKIRENMHIPLEVTDYGLVSYWQFNESGGTSTADNISGNTGTLHNMTTDDWIESEIPFGRGVSCSETETAGTVDFAGTGLSMYFNSQTGSEITVTRIDTVTNINPTEPDTVYDSQYWIINRFNSGAFNADLTFSLNEDLPPEFESNPGFIKLYTRPSTSVGAWNYLKAASYVNADSDQVTFNDITSFCQFIIVRDTNLPDNFAGTALNFDGINDYVNIGNPTNFNVGNTLTIEAWVKPTASGERLSIFSTMLEDESGSFQLEINNVGGVAIRGKNIWVAKTMDNLITVGEWNHIAYTRSGIGGGTHKIYINGAEQILIANEDYTFIDNNSDKVIGSGTSGGQLFHGKIDELRLWNVTRTQTEICENIYLLLSGWEEGLVSYWQFNDGSGTSLSDFISGNIGTLNNMTDDDWIDSTIPFGAGVSNSQTETAGTVNFTGTGLSMYFNSQTGAEITATRIDTMPNTEPDGAFDDQYWVVNRFGSGSFDADLSFTLNEDISDYETNPPQIRLYSRANNSDSSWNYVTYATSVNTSENSVTFEGITEFSQFIICLLKHSDGFPGNALIFDGIDNYVDLGNSLSLKPTNSLTIEMWVYCDDWTAIPNTRFICNTESGGYNIGANSSSNIGTAIRYNNVYNTLTFSTAGLTSGWHHISTTFDGQNHKLLLDGDLKDEREYDINYQIEYNLSNHTLLGAEAGSGSTPSGLYFLGKIDGTRIWNVARSEEEIRENMHLPLSGLEAGLVSYWQFNEGSGTTTADHISGNRGILNNMTDDDWIDSTIPFGNGVANSQTETAGTVNFTDTRLSMYFNSHNGAEITVTRIDTLANISPTEPNVIFDSQYWVVHRFGSGVFNADLTFSLNEDLTEEDESNPNWIKLYTRASTADTNWVYLTDASSVNATTDEATFDVITDFNQFLISRHDLGIPQNVTIEIVGTNVQISWNEVDGANSYKIYSSDNPHSGFTEDLSGMFTDESWIADITGIYKKFYLVIASTETVRYHDSYFPKRKKNSSKEVIPHHKKVLNEK